MKKYVSALLLMVACILPVAAQTPTYMESEVLPVSATTNAKAVASDKSEAQENDPLAFVHRFYKRSGYSYVSLVSVGYYTPFLLPNNPQGYAITEFTGRHHYLNVSFLDFRVRLIGAELLDFEFGVNTPGMTKNGVDLPTIGRGGSTPGSIADAKFNTMWFAWKPTVKFYVPATSWLAAEVYAGAHVDITYLWSQVHKTYYKNDPLIPVQNFFVGAHVGVGLLFAGPVGVPIELKCEYRHPVSVTKTVDGHTFTSNYALVPQGFYLGLQLHVGWMLDNKGKVMNK